MKLLAALAVVPMAIGTMPKQENELIAALCNGGVISIPIGGKDDGPIRDCHEKGCHAGSCRQKSKGWKA